MANEEQLSILKQGVEVWNKWRGENLSAEIDLRKADLRGAYLKGADLFGANLVDINLNGANLSEANLNTAKLFGGTQLREGNLRWAHLMGADLSGADLTRADLSHANLWRAKLWKTNLSEAILRSINLNDANLNSADMSGANLDGANLNGARLNKAKLNGARVNDADLKGADLNSADLIGTYLVRTDLVGANLSQTNLSAAFLREADLTGAVLTDADLFGTTLINVKIDKAKLSSSKVYGVNIWDLEGEFEEQKDLVITRKGQPIITVDNIKVAQFLYLVLNNDEIRDVINTLTSKSVLILGRFAIPERKAILDAVRNKLREYNLLPIVFDFDRPTDKDFTETIKTLAGLSYFVIADITNPKSSPLELQATVPDYQIPFVPIIQEGESPFAMMVDLQKKYNWVLDTISYDSLDTLIEILKPLIIDPAIKMRDKLRIIKAAEPTIISGREWKEKKG